MGAQLTYLCELIYSVNLSQNRLISNGKTNVQTDNPAELGMLVVSVRYIVKKLLTIMPDELQITAINDWRKKIELPITN